MFFNKIEENFKSFIGKKYTCVNFRLQSMYILFKTGRVGTNLQSEAKPFSLGRERGGSIQIQGLQKYKKESNDISFPLVKHTFLSRRIHEYNAPNNVHGYTVNLKGDVN